MKKKERWKVILEYEIGILVLVAVVLMAWFFPDLYASWQDEDQMGEAVVSSRENIQFLDVDSLDIAGRMWLLKNAETMDWVDISDQYFNDQYFSMADQEEELERMLTKMHRLVQQWEDCGVLPKGCAELINPAELLSERDLQNMPTEMDGGAFGVLTDQSVLKVTEICFFNQNLNIPLLHVVMDLDKDLLYYAAAAGAGVWDDFAGRLGYGENTSAYKNLQEVWFEEPELLTVQECGDLAAVSGAKSVTFAEVPEDSDPYARVERDVSLKYNNFDGFAKMQLVRSEIAGFGMAVMLGTDKWEEFVTSTMDYLTGQTVFLMPGYAVDWVENPTGGSWIYRTENEDVYDGYEDDAVEEAYDPEGK